MGIDLFQSRRNYNIKCKWWSRDESNEYTSDELIMSKQPRGYFFAREISRESNQPNQAGGVFRFDSSFITIKTPDDIEGIKVDCLVWFQGEKWIVNNVQKEKAKLQGVEFTDDKHCSHYWYLQLRK